MTKILRLLSAVFILSCMACSAASSTAEAPTPQQLAAAEVEAAVPGFRPLKLGGGGFVVDMDFSPDGRTRIVRTDVHGAYIWDDPTNEWKQLITATSMPARDSFVGKGRSIGVYAIRVSPSDASRLYMASPGHEGIESYLYRSDDRGARWTRTNFAPVEMFVGTAGRLFGPKMAIDPRNPDIVLIGDSAGRIYRTADGGTTWATIDPAQIPTGINPAIAFGKQNADGGSASSELFVATGANGVFRSADGGVSWARTEGGPRSVARLVAAPDGLYATDRDQTTRDNAWKLAGGRWTRFAIPTYGAGHIWHSIAVDPSNPSHVVLGSEAGNVVSSFDAGKTWSSVDKGPPQRKAEDVPWLEWTAEPWMSNGNMMFDPVVPNRLYFAQGIGVWYAQTRADNAKPLWISQTRGIDELIVNDLIVPPGGKPILAVQDRGIFRIESPELFPRTHGPDRDVPIRHGWSVDYSASDPSFIAMVANGGAGDRSGFSNDGGRTWSRFGSNAPSDPPGAAGGMIAVSSSTNMVWGPANNGRPFYTVDGGQTWQLARFPAEVPTSGHLGWSFSFYQNRHIFAADRVLPNTFYAYNMDPAAVGTYRSVDGGATWARVGPSFGVYGSMGTSARLASVPGQAGHLFFVIGSTAVMDPHPYNMPLKRSRDGGRSWQDIRRTQEIWAIGFGKAAPGKTYPSIYIAGYANGDREPALYRSIDDAASWQKLTSYPAGNVDTIRAISGDMNVYGRVYYGFAGSGAGYGVLVN
ncbi:MAG: hypothetical protein V4696_09390 [Pseudomonadota bacterium]